MKKPSQRGFTLIELLVVTVVVVTLMGIVFRLAGLGGESRARAITIRRMQCLENCLSGYYAAYGSYPPVPLQGRSRSIYSNVDTFGVQNSSDEEKGSLDATRIHQACRAQPVAALFPFRNNMKGDLEKYCQAIQKFYGNNTPAKYKSIFSVIKNPGAISKDDDRDWGASQNGNNVQVFQFGLMSFLLPRYLFMFSGSSAFYKNANQWGANNQLPSRLDTGVPYQNWNEIFSIMGGNDADGRISNNEAGMISNLTSQSVCARWMPNLKGIVTGGSTFYGVNTACSENNDTYLGNIPSGGGIETYELHIHSPNGYSKGGGGDPYILNCMTVRDGWHTDFYYYSDPPYQSYRLWSAGPNRKTFPPWYDINQFSGSDITTIKDYISDDFVHLSN
jgi:prepilin-type N-terminal cleavage/methylation domain-containing protein